MKTIYRIKEYGSFIAEKEVEGYVTLPRRTFDQLESFVLTNSGRDTEAVELMGISARKGLGKVITAKKYVGLISMKDGTTIEILPKVFSAVDEDPSGVRTKKLLMDMLKTLHDAPFKSMQNTGVDIEKMNIFEIFVRMFVDEVFFIVKRGLKCSYETIEENTPFFRGKLQVSQHIRQNHSHRERSYVQYDAFTANRPENRLIKATLQYLSRRSTSQKNRTDIRNLLNSFAEVDASLDWKSDFAKYIPDRNTKDYTTALMWSRVFLMGKSFTAFSGDEIAVALLFPMEELFESYIAALMKKRLSSAQFSVTAQDKRYHLFDKPGKRFLLKPDLVIRRKEDDKIFIMDTKWKVLSAEKTNYGISQLDMYQMYAYQKKYGAENVTLLYPRTDRMPSEKLPEFESEDGVKVKVRFVDLFDTDRSLTELIEEFIPAGE